MIVSGNRYDGARTVRILIADSDQEHRNRVRKALASDKEFEVLAVVADGERAARLCAQLLPDVAILEIGMERSDGSSALESIAMTSPSCHLVVMAPSNDPDLLRLAMMQGARAFLVKPVESDQVVQAVRRIQNLVARRQAGDDAPPPPERQTGQIISVWGPKGGVGRTFLAVNLAVSMAAQQARRVLLMDGCLGFCTADLALDIEGKKTIIDLVMDNDADLEPEMISRVVIRHSSGLDVLLAPPVGHMVIISPAHLERIVRVMRRLYEFVIIDTRSVLDETTLAFLDLADVVLTICNPEIASLRNLRVFLDSLGQLGFPANRVQLVLNRSDMRGAISAPEIEKVCRQKVLFNIPNDHEAASMSINRGQPLVLSQPARPIAREIANMAAVLSGGSGSNGHSKEAPAGKTGLARLLARGGGQR